MTEHTYLVRFPWTGHELTVRATGRREAAARAQDAVAATGLAHRADLALYSTKRMWTA